MRPIRAPPTEAPGVGRSVMQTGIKGVRPRHVIAQVWLANGIGAALLLAEYVVTLPFPDRLSTPAIVHGNIVIGISCVLASWAILLAVVAPRVKRALAWTVTGREPTPEERELTLRLPWRLFWFQVATWLVSCIVIFWHNAHLGTGFAIQLAGIVFGGGLVTSTTSYLMTGRLFRPAIARVLEMGGPRRFRGIGVGARAVFIWALTTGVPVLGLFLLLSLAGDSGVSTRRLTLTGLVIGAIALGGGLFATILFAKSVGEPLCELTTALEKVEAGNLSVSVRVDDAGEIGQLQAGLNNMVLAMREREQLRDLFGRHVGVDVARQALKHGVALGGEEREVSALFVDVIGSTTFAAQRPPHEVVAALNRFFEVVVTVVDQHGGLVNKFEGDAALCIFGAPLELPDPAAAALAAARTMATRLRAEVPDLEAGIGVSHGLVIAGNIGSTARLEYTVIGDAVNEAARLTEQAKDRPERVVASERIVDRAAADERDHWRLLEPVLLRGRLDSTTLAVPT